jgi:hypothetical protein
MQVINAHGLLGGQGFELRSVRASIVIIGGNSATKPKIPSLGDEQPGPILHVSVSGSGSEEILHSSIALK